MNKHNDQETDRTIAPREVIYHADPLCGWCFAIAEEVEAARGELGESVRWTVRMGGLVVGERVRRVALDADYLRAGLAQVEQASGRRASAAYFDNIVARGTWVSDSEPVCRAVLAAIEVGGDGAGITAAALLSELLYTEGLEPDSEEGVGRVADAIGVARSEFVALWRSDDLRQRLVEHWRQTRRSELKTYPTIALVEKCRARPLLSGYAEKTTIVSSIRTAIAGR